jgi:hypothetical protein
MENQVQQTEGCGGRPMGFRGSFPVWIVPIGMGLFMGMMIRRKQLGFAHHHHRNWENGVPPMFMEWHRRAHENQPQPPTATV